jgi:Spy/CpxP family protein refolding chaperone
MTRTRTWLIGALAALGLAGAAWAGAPGGWHGHHGGAGMEFMHVLKQLNLSPEQKTQVKSIMESARPQFQALGDSMRQNHEAMLSTAPTDASYPALLQKAKENAAARIDQMHAVHQQIYSVLTPEQQAKIPSIVAADKAKWQANHAPVGGTT